MSFSQKIIQGLAWGQMGMLARTLICFLVSIITATALGSEQYGVYAVLFSVVLMLVRFSEMGTEAVINTYIPKYNASHEPGKASYIIRRIVVYRSILIVLICAVFYGLFANNIKLVDALDNENILLVLAWFAIRASMDSFIYLIWAGMAMKFHAAVEIFISLLQLFAVIVLSFQSMQLTQLIAIMVLINSIQLIAYAYHNIPLIRAKPVKVSRTPVNHLALTMWLSTILHFFISKGIDIIMIVQYTSDTRQAAYYDIAHLLVVTGALGLSTAITSLKLPILSEAYDLRGMGGLRQSWKLLSQLSMFLSAPILLFFAVYAEPLINLLYGQAYHQVILLLQLFALMILINKLLADEVSPFILFPLQKSKLYLILYGSQGLLNLLLNFALIPKYGAIGAVIATGMSAIALNFLTLWLTLKKMKTRLPVRFILLLVLAMTIAISLSLFLPHQNLLQLLVKALIYGIITTLILGRFHRFSIKERILIKQYRPRLHATLMKFNLL